MSRHEFDPACPDCRPTLLDAKTGRPVPESDPFLQTLLTVWEKSPRADQEAFHRVTVLNSKAPWDLARAGSIMDRFKAEAVLLGLDKESKAPS